MPVIAGIDMSVIIAFVVGIGLIYLVGRMFLLPVRMVFKLIYNAVIGGVALWLINLLGAHFGFALPLNPITALLVGFLGLPGVALLILFKIFFA